MQEMIRKFLLVVSFGSWVTGAWAAPHIVDDPNDLSELTWAAFHPTDDGLHQQMSLRAKAGSLFYIESSDDLETWTVEATQYGFFDGQILENLLFERSQATAGSPPSGGGVLADPKKSVYLMIQSVPSGGILVSWNSLADGTATQYHLTGKSLDPAWSTVIFSGGSDDDYSVTAMVLGVYTGNLPTNPFLFAADEAFVLAFGSLFDTMNASVATYVPTPSAPASNSGAKKYYRVRADFFVDSDGDGISDAVEMEIGTDSFNSDSDGDGYSDGYEQDEGSDPKDATSTPSGLNLRHRTVLRRQTYDYDEFGDRLLQTYMKPQSETENLEARLKFDTLMLRLSYDMPFPALPPAVAKTRSVGNVRVSRRGSIDVVETNGEERLVDFSRLSSTRVWLEQQPAPTEELSRRYLKVTQRSVNDSELTFVAGELVDLVIPAGQFYSNPVDLDPDYSSIRGDDETGVGAGNGNGNNNAGGSSSSIISNPATTGTGTEDDDLEGANELVRVSLVPVHIAPDVLAVNSDFDEGRIDPVTGYAIPDCDDIPGVDRKTGAGNSALRLDTDRAHLDGLYVNDERVTDDMHRGWFGVKPNSFDDEFWDDATVTISKLDRIDADTGYEESGQVRFYAKWGNSYYGIAPYDLGTLAAVNLVGGGVNKRPGEGVYGSNSTIPDDAEFWMEGVRPGKITLEWRMQKGSFSMRYEQTFLVTTQKSKQEWIDEVFYQVKLQSLLPKEQMEVAGGYGHALTAFPVDLTNFNPTQGFYIQTLSTNYVYIQSIYLYYSQLFKQNPEEFHWAGMAKVAGAAVYAGMVDMNTWRFSPIVGDADIDPILNDFMIQGNKDIFLDMAWAHHAYASSGIWGVRYVEESQLASEPDSTDYSAWEDLDAGIRGDNSDLLDRGNRDILWREQDVVMQPLWDSMKLVSLPSSKVEQFLTLNLVGGMAYPPTNSADEINMDEMFSLNSKNPIDRIAGPGIQDLIPNGRMSNFADRWEWIENPDEGMLAIWLGSSSPPGLGFDIQQRATSNGLAFVGAAYHYSILPEVGNFRFLQFPPGWQ